jgi:Ca2+-binding RTX toxin-like protein
MGNYGLEVTPGSATCLAAERVDLVTALLLGDVTACSFLTATDTTVLSSLDLRAGVSIALGNGFRVNPSVTFAAILDSSLTRLAYVVDRSPDAETSYKASFWLRLDDLNFGLDDEFVHLVGLSKDRVAHFQVSLKHMLFPIPNGEDRLVLNAREDSGTIITTAGTEEVMLPAGYNLVEIDWLAGAGTGHFRISLNGAPFGGLEGLDNDEARIDSIRWGIADAEVDNTTGHLDQDDFSSSR